MFSHRSFNLTPPPKYIYGFLISHEIIVFAAMFTILFFPEFSTSWSPITLSLNGQSCLRSIFALSVVNALAYGILFIPSAVLHIQALLMFLALKVVFQFVGTRMELVDTHLRGALLPRRRSETPKPKKA
jgi:hypothetical protein